MSAELEKVEERQQKRYSLLKTIYDNAGDSFLQAIRYSDAVEKAGQDKDLDIFVYLRDKGLLSSRTGTGWVALSHEGIIEVEQSILYPEEETDHFRAGVVQRFYAAVGVVQNAADSMAHVTQNNERASRALNSDQQLVMARQERRRRVMHLIYEKAEGRINKYVYKKEIKAEEGLSDVEYQAVFDYLKEEGLVDVREVGGGGFNITQRGIEYVERQIKHPEVRDDFNQGRSEQHFYAQVGAVQNAPGSTAYVTQNNISSAGLLPLIEELRARLEALPDNQDALERLHDLEDEARLENPKGSRIKAAALYIASIVKDVSVSVAAEAIIKAVGG